MQPGTNPDDLHTILSRFHTWAEKDAVSNNVNGRKNGAGPEGVREIPYEEAIRRYRKRRTGERRLPASLGAAPATDPSEFSPRKQTAESGTLAVRYRDANALSIPSVQGPSMTAAPMLQSDAATLAGKTPVGAQTGTAQSPREQITQTAKLRGTKRPEAASKVSATDLSIPTEFTVSSSRRRTDGRGEQEAEIRERISSTFNKPPVQLCAETKMQSAAAQTSRASNAKRPAKRSATAPAPKQGATAVPRPLTRRHPPFRQILASTVQAKPTQTKVVRAKTVQGNPQPTKAQVAQDRSRRITTRFSAAEQRRIEKQAAQVGLTVSAWMRQCALSQAQADIPPQRTKRREATQNAAEATTALSQPSVLGSWLTLLRHRFLASPERFSERA